jgi:hypothetical protein
MWAHTDDSHERPAAHSNGELLEAGSSRRPKSITAVTPATLAATSSEYLLYLPSAWYKWSTAQYLTQRAKNKLNQIPSNQLPRLVGPALFDNMPFRAGNSAANADTRTTISRKP